ncbi:MAG: sigma-70 family RNA polymerase sigma factor [Gemmatimonadota bacterium]|nr:sigma-70 family RNA polymerase sigma factor [Gemmatimonadota bacterium]MDH4349563.1 sigma-70 family RNA polymerase sigma factor [Gemmatimonadota bacterium]MDH5195739.1 sigma-70 family RNA polymerase sigma factor [Gemmatimonadota bacterium]
MTPGRSQVSTFVPPQLAGVLAASDDVTRGHAWAAFLHEYSTLLLKVARRTAPSHDGAMDRYAFILDQLRDDGCRRLRAFAADGRGKFTTWLVVVARRLCVDYHRHTHGRLQAEQESSPAQALEHVARRNLVDFVAAEIDLEQMGDGKRPHPDAEVLREERRTALRHVVAKLDVADQLLLTLRFEDDVPLNKIGQMIGLRSRFQVHRRLTAVLARLKDGLEARGISEP